MESVTLMCVHFYFGLVGSPQRSPLSETRHTQDWLSEWLAPPHSPQATPAERWDPGCRPADKARKLLLVRHFRGGHDFHNNKHI